MRYWRLPPSSGAGQLDLGRAAQLVAAIGHQNINALAEEMLKTAAALIPVSQCTIFAYEHGNRPRTIAVADQRGGIIRDIAQAYVRHFYALDGNQEIIAGTPQVKTEGEGTILLHHQNSEEIEHPGYRAICYQKAEVSDRVALLLQPERQIWLSVNFYRSGEQGHFLAHEIARFEGLAVLFAHAARHHYALRGQSQTSIPEMMLARLRNLCPSLSKRELDVLRGILQGHTSAEIAELMGIRPSSVTTYLKRAYHRLGISSQRQLFALCLDPVKRLI